MTDPLDAAALDFCAGRPWLRCAACGFVADVTDENAEMVIRFPEDGGTAPEAVLCVECAEAT